MNRLFKLDSVKKVLSTHFEAVTLSTKSTQIMRPRVNQIKIINMSLTMVLPSRRVLIYSNKINNIQ